MLLQCPCHQMNLCKRVNIFPCVKWSQLQYRLTCNRKYVIMYHAYLMIFLAGLRRKEMATNNYSRTKNELTEMLSSLHLQFSKTYTDMRTRHNIEIKAFEHFKKQMIAKSLK